MPQLLALNPLLVGVPDAISFGLPLNHGSMYDFFQGVPESFTLQDGNQDPWPVWADSPGMVKLYSTEMPQR